ncbi:hypothetical protein L596_023206 [Steinernema carpocapsae]|uniref:SXP/RAL-2 family protein Ani s 5-like cation-binding domain-containing protein n=1 Tax=Steinernema carpocapsae TaxID=34508 RepID=A0A4U5MCY7_STECR|nr:hypothetical protein L596_023206 [Steinernema carpocapsae]
MKYSLALVVLAAAVFVVNAAPAGNAANSFEQMKALMPPIIGNALESFSQKGKDVMVKIMDDAMAARKADKPFGKAEFMAAVKAQAPDDFPKLESAEKELYDKIEASSSKIQNLFKMTKVFMEDKDALQKVLVGGNNADVDAGNDAMAQT